MWYYLPLDEKCLTWNQPISKQSNIIGKRIHPDPDLLKMMIVMQLKFPDRSSSPEPIRSQRVRRCPRWTCQSNSRHYWGQTNKQHLNAGDQIIGQSSTGCSLVRIWKSNKSFINKWILLISFELLQGGTKHVYLFNCFGVLTQ